MEDRKYPLFGRGCAVALLLWVVGIIFSQSAVLAFALAAMPIVATIAWRNKEYPVFTFAFLFQWMQVSLGVVWRDIFRVDLAATASPRTDLACYLGIAGLLVLAVGVRSGFSIADIFLNIKSLDSAEETRYSIKKVFVLYLILSLLVPVVSVGSWKFMQFRSMMLVISVFQHFMVFLLFYLAIVYNQPFYVVFTLLFEIAQGMVGYFSGYKTSLFIFAMVALGNLKKLNVRMKYVLLATVALLFVLSLAWQAIKPELRTAFNDGTLSLSGPIDKKLQFVARLIEKAFRGNTEPYYVQSSDENKVYALVNRVSNIYYFACVLERIPSEYPYEDGKLLWNSLQHIIKPRLFFPDKAGLPSDSWMIRTYAGVDVAGTEENTNIALGYLAEDYIDFGIPYMFIPVLILGILAGVMYRYIFKIAQNQLIANAVSASIFFFNFYLFEKANIKIFGNLLSDYIFSIAVLLLFQKQFLKFITIKNSIEAVKKIQ